MSITWRVYIIATFLQLTVLRGLGVSSYGYYGLFDCCYSAAITALLLRAKLKDSAAPLLLLLIKVLIPLIGKGKDFRQHRAGSLIQA